MPRQPGSPAEIIQFRTTDQIDAAIRKLERRIQDIEAIGADGVRHRDARVQNVQHSIRDTIQEIFGSGSQQLDRHRYFKVDNAPHIAGTNFDDLGELEERRQAKFVEGISGAITRIRGLIDHLDEKREELAKPEAAPRVAFEGRSLHPAIGEAATDLYRDGHYAQAVFEAGKALVALVKETSGDTMNRDGSDLMQAVFSPKNPMLAFSELIDQTDRSEQQGMMFLYAGAVMAIRNPGGHRVGFIETPQRALQYLELLSLLAERVGDTQRR